MKISNQNSEREEGILNEDIETEVGRIRQAYERSAHKRIQSISEDNRGNGKELTPNNGGMQNNAPFESTFELNDNSQLIEEEKPGPS